jgi:hypothetical protein
MPTDMATPMKELMDSEAGGGARRRPLPAWQAEAAMYSNAAAPAALPPPLEPALLADPADAAGMLASDGAHRLGPCCHLHLSTLCVR